jgi:hypothetical protein
MGNRLTDLASVKVSKQGRRASLLGGIVALVSTLLFAAMLWVQPLLAAVEFDYFNVISSPSGVVLEWNTRAESNISGFDVLCRRDDQPETAFHSIGYVPAKGRQGAGALYTFDVMQLEPGVPYCFRLLELTTDGTAGEVQDRCGYGISMTPTPKPFGERPVLPPGATPAITPTPGGPPVFDPLAATATAQALLIQQGGDPFGATATAQALLIQQGGDPFGATATAQALLIQQGGDPFGATATAQALLIQQQSFDQAATATAQALLGYPSPTSDASFPPTETPTSYPSPTLQANADGAAVAAAVVEATPTMPQALAAAAPQAFNDAPGMTPEAPQLRSDGLAVAPTPAYIVATASPTLEAVVFGPGMTPLPTVTPTAGLAQLVNLVEPTSQNLMVMLLCMTFTGATGLGILGLITSVMFMRSRSSQREFYDRHSNRRRY